jgi:hypothetical protein
VSSIDRDPKGYPENDGTCPEQSLSYLIWHRGRPRKIGDLSPEELRGALLDAQNDLNLVCLHLYRSDNPDEKAVLIANRHRVTSEEEEALMADGAAPWTSPLPAYGPPMDELFGLDEHLRDEAWECGEEAARRLRAEHDLQVEAQASMDREESEVAGSMSSLLCFPLLPSCFGLGNSYCLNIPF